MAYMSEAEKIKPLIEKYLNGKSVLDIGCADHKVVPHAIGVDGRAMPGVDVVTDGLSDLSLSSKAGMGYDTVFSSHLLEHLEDPAYMIHCWRECLKIGGHLILYLPDKGFYDSSQNPEHLFDWEYKDFMFFFNRVFCGEGKNFKGEHIYKLFEVVESGVHHGDDLYSFYLIAKRV